MISDRLLDVLWRIAPAPIHDPKLDLRVEWQNDIQNGIEDDTDYDIETSPEPSFGRVVVRTTVTFTPVIWSIADLPSATRTALLNAAGARSIDIVLPEPAVFLPLPPWLMMAEELNDIEDLGYWALQSEIRTSAVAYANDLLTF